MFKNFKNTVRLFFSNIKQIKLDKVNRALFINDIKQAISDPRSTFNKLHLQCDDNYTHISTIINIPEEFQIAATDIDKYRKLSDMSKSVNKYLINELNWGEYFVSPEYFYIDTNTADEIENGVSCAYLATWRYSPILNKYPNFKYQFAAFIGINITLVLAVIVLLGFIIFA